MKILKEVHFFSHSHHGLCFSTTIIKLIPAHSLCIYVSLCVYINQLFLSTLHVNNDNNQLGQLVRSSILFNRFWILRFRFYDYIVTINSQSLLATWNFFPFLHLFIHRFLLLLHRWNFILIYNSVYRPCYHHHVHHHNQFGFHFISFYLSRY